MLGGVASTGSHAYRRTVGMVSRILTKRCKSSQFPIDLSFFFRILKGFMRLFAEVTMTIGVMTMGLLRSCVVLSESRTLG